MRKLATAFASAAAMLVAVVLPTASGAQETDPVSGSDAEFSQQAEDAGLTVREAANLQRRVDREIARTDGTQVSLNKVLWGDGNGSTLLALPGERQARDVTDPSANAQECDYENLCVYTDTYYDGDEYSFWKCGTYDVSTIPFESWINNQIPGTTAYFWDSNGDLLLATTAYDYDPVDATVGLTTWTIKNC